MHEPIIAERVLCTLASEGNDCDELYACRRWVALKHSPYAPGRADLEPPPHYRPVEPPMPGDGDR